MTLNDLMNFKRTSSKLIIIDATDMLNQKEIFAGYETTIDDKPNPEYEDFMFKCGGYKVINFGASVDFNNIPSVSVLVER